MLMLVVMAVAVVVEGSHQARSESTACTVGLDTRKDD